jgi:hypothetical protein
MGRRTNPNILRLGGKALKWKSNFIEKKSHESSVYHFKNLEIKNFIEYFLKKNELLLKDFRIYFCKSATKIYISFYTSSKSASLINKTNAAQKIKLKKYVTHYTYRRKNSIKVLSHLINQVN